MMCKIQVGRDGWQNEKGVSLSKSAAWRDGEAQRHADVWCSKRCEHARDLRTEDTVAAGTAS
eukprot:508082-Rhodomonas_salina.1